MTTVLYSADVVCPMTRPPMPDAGVLVDGDRIVAVDAASALRVEARREHHVAGVVLPGFVNGHAHLEFSDAREQVPPGPFLEWLRALGAVSGAWDEERWGRSARRGVQEVVRAGTAAVGDVVTRGPAVPAAARAGLAGDSWVEVVAVDSSRLAPALEGVEHALGLPAGDRRVGVAPHAPYSVGTEVLRALARIARDHHAPLHVSAAETRDEVLAVRDGAGAFADHARDRGYAFEWLDGGTGLSPVAYLDECGVLGAATTVAHGVWVGDDDAALLAERGTSVVCCPRSNTALGVGQAPLERYAEAGTRLALGTDSGASTPDLDPLGEAAAWVRLARARGLSRWPGRDGPVELTEQAILLATVDGAWAMGWGQVAGVLEPGRRADLVGVAVETTPDTVYRDLVEEGAGRQVLTIGAGVRRARREAPAVAWPPIDRDSWR